MRLLNIYVAILLFLYGCSSSPQKLFLEVDCPKISILYEGQELYRYVGQHNLQNLSYHVTLQFNSSQCHVKNNNIITYDLPVMIEVTKGASYDKNRPELAITSAIIYGNDTHTIQNHTVVLEDNINDTTIIKFILPVIITMNADTKPSDYQHILSLQLTQDEITNIRQEGSNIAPLF